MLSAGLQTQKGYTFCSSRFDVHFVETRTLYSPDDTSHTCHDWGLLSAFGICQLVLTYQRKT